MKQQLRLSIVGLLLLSLILAACGGTGEGDPVATEAPAEDISGVEDEPESAEPTPTQLLEEEPPTAIPPTEIISADKIAPLVEVILTRATDAKIVGESLTMMMSLPVPGGESVIFHFEDIFKGTDLRVGCTGHATLELSEDESAYEVVGISASCSQTIIESAITALPSRGPDESGQEMAIVYGEIYDGAVVAIRVFWDGGETVALISRGAYIAMIPLDATGINVIAYDAEGSILFDGSTNQ